jgi:DNA-binding MarR family transcriptional regulator
MGSVYCTAGELVMLALYVDEAEQSTVTSLVERLGLLQPTVSMSVGALVDKELVVRVHIEGGSARSMCIVLTEQGYEAADQIARKISRLVVRRRPRS